MIDLYISRKQNIIALACIYVKPPFQPQQNIFIYVFLTYCNPQVMTDFVTHLKKMEQIYNVSSSLQIYQHFFAVSVEFFNDLCMAYDNPDKSDIIILYF